MSSLFGVVEKMNVTHPVSFFWGGGHTYVCAVAAVGSLIQNKVKSVLVFNEEWASRKCRRTSGDGRRLGRKSSKKRKCRCVSGGGVN